MRVTDKIIYSSLTSSLSSAREALEKSLNIVSSGKKILTSSDDPVGASSCVKYKAEISLNEQYQKNLKSLQTLGSYYETSMDTISDLLTEAKQIATTQSSGTMDASTRTSASEEIKAIIEELVAVGNTKLGNNYIFSGTKSTTVSFTMDGDYNVTFNGSSEVFSVYVDRSTTKTAGISGESVFISDTNIFQVLKDLNDALEGNDTDGIGEAIDNLNDALDQTETNVARVGAYLSNIDSLIEDNDSRSTYLTEVLSEIEDADTAQAVTDYNTLSTAYQAILTCISKVQSLNVLNYFD